jgi:hypothetical protein
VSEQAGLSNILSKAKLYGLNLAKEDPACEISNAR